MLIKIFCESPPATTVTRRYFGAIQNTFHDTITMRISFKTITSSELTDATKQTRSLPVKLYTVPQRRQC